MRKKENEENNKTNNRYKEFIEFPVGNIQLFY
jgi:hypothetical protein